MRQTTRASRAPPAARQTVVFARSLSCVSAEIPTALNASRYSPFQICSEASFSACRSRSRTRASTKIASSWRSWTAITRVRQARHPLSLSPSPSRDLNGSQSATAHGSVLFRADDWQTPRSAPSVPLASFDTWHTGFFLLPCLAPPGRGEATPRRAAVLARQRPKSSLPGFPSCVVEADWPLPWPHA